MTKTVDNYLLEGCGRCPLGGTPECKVHLWTKELQFLRQIILDCGLTEEIKWDVPVYTYHQKNILILAAFKKNCTISFFKGSILSDTENILDKPGEYTQAARLIRFTNTKDILKLEPTIKAYIYEAIEVEKLGMKVITNDNNLEIPAEFQSKLEAIPALKAAFQALTPGRQRAYILHFAAAKHAQTRTARVEKYIPQILQGRGFLE